ncbi:serine/threonine protein kinase [Lujinxingia sediminis]|uniref:non-specific serine/threonine protein kinase n=1 Tax=Lujinxingia sediminis TaxID=2480984 RepID=A0ABY0CNR9_9DELT|nr:protein kinase [Lujinxingia sediminis]RVU41619.1 serine/threonine protein kinase [Lujinxingia sediminis]
MLTLKDGRYHCSEILGEGSMGRTYLATDHESGQQVALKALYPSRLATLKDFELFEREARILQQLDHPRVPAYIDAFCEGEGDAVCYYIVQAYAGGGDLRALLDSDVRFDEERLLDLMIALAEILDYLHTQEPAVVHRDLKPANIIMCDEGKTPTLVDFGAVREVVRLTMGGGSTIIGTFGYMPPEQLMGRALPASDLYALGITSLECLTRRTPSDLHGEDAAAMIEELNGVSTDLKRVLRRLCAPRIDERYPSAGNLLQDLKQLKSAQTLIHIDRLERDIARRQREREKALVNATGTAVTFLAGLIGFVILGAGFVGAILVLRELITNLELPIIVAMAVSIVGLLVPLGILATRYIRDAWQPPPANWLNLKATFTGITREPYGEGTQVCYYLNYTFEHRGQPFEKKITLAITNANPYFQNTKVLERMSRLHDHAGTEFDVFVDPANPHNHVSVEFYDAEQNFVEPVHHFASNQVHHPA